MKFEIRYIEPMKKNNGGLSIMTVEARDMNAARKYFLNNRMNKRPGIIIESIKEARVIQLQVERNK